MWKQFETWHFPSYQGAAVTSEGNEFWCTDIQMDFWSSCMHLRDLSCIGQLQILRLGLQRQNCLIIFLFRASYTVAIGPNFRFHAMWYQVGKYFLLHVENECSIVFNHTEYVKKKRDVQIRIKYKQKILLIFGVRLSWGNIIQDTVLMAFLFFSF
jgi:hypothetical protein